MHSSRRLTDGEEQQIKSIYEVGGFGAVRIAKAYGCSVGLIYSAIKRQGGRVRSRVQLTPEEEQQIVAIYEVGRFSYAEIAKTYGFKPMKIYGILKRRGAKIRRGSEAQLIAHSRRRMFTREEKEQIAHIYNAGYSSIRIAKAYGCGYSAILKAVRDVGGTIRPAGCNTEHGRQKLSRTKRMFTETEDEEIKKIYEIGGYTSLEMATAYNCNNTTILESLRRAGAAIRNPHLPGKDNPAWKGGTSKDPYPFKFDEGLKESIRKRDGHVCQLCSLTEEKSGKKLPVHHIDYNKRNIDPLNLVTLCNSCHSKVNFKRVHWTEHFSQKVVRC